MSPLPPEVIAADHALSDDEPIQFTREEVRREKQAAEQRRRARFEELWREAWEKQQAAAQMLTAWANAHAKRDDVVRTAHDAGLSVHRIHRITGIARTTITRIISG